MSKEKVVEFSKDGKSSKIILANSYLEVEVSTLGATLVALRLLKCQDERDVVCGLNSAEEYLAHDKYFGACVGRVAGRIDKGTFTLNGKTYQLACNNNGNALHGGLQGFNTKHFTYELFQENDEELGVKLSYTSLEGEEGYPGSVELDVTYVLRENTLQIKYYATSSEDTIINMTNHSYFNLKGHSSPSVLDHTLQVASEALLEIEEDSCPRGKVLTLAGTPFDFRTPKTIAECLNGSHEQLTRGKGIDHYFIFSQPNNQIVLACEKVRLTVSTNQLGANIYTANYLDGKLIGKKGVAYPEKCAICLETQNYGNEINIHEQPTTILRSGDVYEAYTNYTFEVEE